MTAAWPSVAPGHMHSAAFHQLSPNITQAPHLRVQKRRHEPDDGDTDTGARDDAMDRSPTPERVKKAPLKKARVGQTDAVSKDGKSTRDSKSSGNSDDDVDVGVLLGGSPQLLTSISSHQFCAIFS
jgi:hypothetical protein